MLKKQSGAVLIISLILLITLTVLIAFWTIFLYNSVNEIYDIIPESKRTKTGYKKFLFRFFKDGTSKDILKILSQTKGV